MVEIDERTYIRAPRTRCFDLARSVEVHVLRNVHFGEPAQAIGGVTQGLLKLGDRVTWRAKHFYVRQTLVSEITSIDPPYYFQDTMIEGAFRSMQHDHFFRELPSGDTEMEDIFYFSAPLGVLGRVAEAAVLRRYMRKLVRERAAVIREAAESEEWRQYLTEPLR